MKGDSATPLAIPRQGVHTLKLYDASGQNITFSAWQSPEKNTPKRMVVRVDGIIKNAESSTPGTNGFPCGVALVRYTIGGLTREVKVDAVTESALTVWAESIDVTAVKDDSRIAALAAFFGGAILPCSEQAIAAAISGCECGDTGVANARYLAIVPVVSSEENQTVVLPVPPDARSVRLLDTVDNTGMALNWPSALVYTYNFWTVPPNSGHIGLIESVDASLLLVQPKLVIPADAKFMSIDFGATISTVIVAPIWAEWVMAAATF